MINRLERYDLNCSVFNSYDYDDCLSLNELLCRFFTKINECIEASNKSLTLLEWLHEVGLKQEVVTLLGQWKDDGTLAELISEQILTEIKQNIENNKNAIEQLQLKDTTHDEKIQALETKDDEILGEIETLKSKDTELEGSISSVSNRMSTNERNITTLQGNVRDLGAKDTELENGLNVLKASSVIKVVKNESELREALGKYNSIICDFATLDLTQAIEVPSNTRLMSFIDTVVKNTNGNLDNLMRNKSNGQGGYNGSKNIIIDGFVFDGLDRESTGLTLLGIGHAKNIEITNCTFKDLHIWHMIELNACKNATVKYNTFSNYGTRGSEASEVIQLDGAFNSTVFPWITPHDKTMCMNIFIESNDFNNIGLITNQYACVGNHWYEAGSVTMHVRVRDNRGSNVACFVKLNDYKDLIIENNDIYNIGIFSYFKGQQNATNRLTLHNNSVYGWDGYTGEQRLIMIENNSNSPKCERVTITNNKISNMATHAIGVTADDVVISENTIRGVKKTGIYMYGGERWSVNNNVLFYVGDYTSSPQIKVGGNSSLPTKHFTVTGNVCVGNSKVGEINVAETSGVGVVANNVANVTGSTSNIIKSGNVDQNNGNRN
jgi:hypothetical protein|nr:MAG TPA: chromosome segregation ATPase [Caudoviricetes sp.]